MELLLSDSVVGLFFQVVPIALLAGLVYAAGRYTVLQRRGVPVVWRTELLRVMFVCYVVGLVNLVLVPPNFWNHIWYYVFTGHHGGELGPFFTMQFNFVPTFVRYLTGEFAGSPGRWIVTMLVGNFLMLVPMGAFLPLVFPKLQGWRVWAAAVAIPLAIELLQPIVGRSFDTDDLITNFLGILAGWGLVKLLQIVRKLRSPH